jgi:hypothetical protein
MNVSPPPEDREDRSERLNRIVYGIHMLFEEDDPEATVWTAPPAPEGPPESAGESPTGPRDGDGPKE